MTFLSRLTCRDASWLITTRLDEALGSLERDALQHHLTICDACSSVVRQFDLMRAAVRDLRDLRDCV